MTIKIPVNAEFNDADVKKQIDSINAQFKSLGESVAKASKTKFNPITLHDKEDLKYFIQQSEKLLKIQSGMRSQMNKSGQGDKNPVFANWGKMYLNEQTRMKRMQEMLVFYGGDFEKQPPGPPAPRGRVPVNPWKQQGTNILQTGLNSMGPLGRISANSLSVGASNGFGAGLAGLVGGIAALGVGKLIAGIASKVSDAQTESVMTDQLLRRLGGNSGFESLRRGVRFGADSLGVKINDLHPLAAQYAASANLPTSQAGQLPQELLTSGQFARGFGLDLRAGTSFFGSMRNMHATGGDQDARKLGLLIGETIAKSNAFSKADEVMDAISGFVSNQTRITLSSPNIKGYAGEFSALTGSGIPGLDPSGASSLLSRVNSALMSGGARGEASQFLTSAVANRMGLNPMQMAVLREGGAFATNSQMFGDGSAANRYGMHGPSGDKTFLSATLDTLRSKYKDPNMLAMATANHLGIGMNQAFSLLKIKPNQLGGMQNRLERLGVNLGTMDASGIADLGRISNADKKGLSDLASEFMGREGKGSLSDTEKSRLQSALNSGDTTKLRDLLSVLAAQKGQQETEGSKTRDTIAKVDNTMQEYASKSLPLLNDSRAALLFLAGKQGGGGPMALRKYAVDAEHQDRMSMIDAKFANVVKARKDYESKYSSLIALGGSMVGNTDRNQLRDRDALAEQEKPYLAAQAAENARYQSQLQSSDKAEVDQYNADEAAQRKAAGDAPNPRIVEGMESNWQSFDKDGSILKSKAGALGAMQTMPGTLSDPGYGVSPAKNKSPQEMRRVGRDYLQAMFDRYHNTDQALAAYNWGPGHMDSLLGDVKKRDQWFSHLPDETKKYIRNYHKQNAAMTPVDDPTRKTAMNNSSQPRGVSVGGEANVNFSMSDDLRRLLNPPTQIKVALTEAQPWGIA